MFPISARIFTHTHTFTLRDSQFQIGKCWQACDVNCIPALGSDSFTFIQNHSCLAHIVIYNFYSFYQRLKIVSKNSRILVVVVQWRFNWFFRYGFFIHDTKQQRIYFYCNNCRCVSNSCQWFRFICLNSISKSHLKGKIPTTEPN